jgi:hypothetical protein
MATLPNNIKKERVFQSFPKCNCMKIWYWKYYLFNSCGDLTVNVLDLLTDGFYTRQLKLRELTMLKALIFLWHD